MTNDSSQDAVVYCQQSRIFVEAPAGYGKTTTMVKKLANDLLLGSIPNPKRVLALTFSVNAARKMKNDIQICLEREVLLSRESKMLARKVDVHNYHSLSRRIISLYGQSVLNIPQSVNGCLPINDNKVFSYLQSRGIAFSTENNEVLNSYASAIKRCDRDAVDRLFDTYCMVVINSLMPNGVITYNGILSLALKILRDNQPIRDLYQHVYSYIIVDEAQDTNILSYGLLGLIVSRDAKISMFGDSLQKIYGFIGAIPDFDKVAIKAFGLTRMELKTNHRFAPNSSMQLLDRNIRANILDSFEPSVKTLARVPLFFLNSVTAEEKKVCLVVKRILSEQPSSRIAILLHTRGYFGDSLPQMMKDEQIECFNALFEDDDEDYVKFNNQCLDVLNEATGYTGNVTLPVLKSAIDRMPNIIEKENYRFESSYISLLNALYNQVEKELRSVSPEIKYEFLSNVFQNRTLRHSFSFIPSNVFLSTIHSAKGLEWDYVIIPEMMQWITPSYVTCKNCCMEKHLNKEKDNKCIFNGNVLPDSYTDEQCVFYVAVTRAKKNVIFFATTDRINSSYEHKHGLISCMLLMPGIRISHVENIDDILV